MSQGASLSFPSQPEAELRLGSGSAVIGRSKECDLSLQDPYISRKQAVISYANGSYGIENIGRNPVQVNGRAVQQAVLRDGDTILFGSTEAIFHLAEDPGSEEEALEAEARSENQLEAAADEGTVFLSSKPEATGGPHLILSGEGREPERIELRSEPISIGRSPEADVILSDAAVSREHGRIEKKGEGYTVVNLSRTNPLLVNDEAVASARLYAGDRLQIGHHSLTFLSDRAEDQRPAQEPAWKNLSSTQLVAGAVLTFLVLLLGGYFVVTDLVRPWRVSRALEQSEALLKSEQHRQAIASLEDLLGRDLRQAHEDRARSLLARATAAAAKELKAGKQREQAKNVLRAYLEEHGAGKAAEPAWSLLDRLLLEEAQAREQEEAYQQALRLYGSIRQNGPLADEARNGIRRIWLSFQQQQMEKQSVAELLQKAEENFIAKRYLTPVNQNAYAVYTSVLAIDPDNKVALRRIEQMKAFYERNGKRYFESGRFQRALIYFERYAIIDPDNPAINAKIKACRSELVGRRSAAPPSQAKAQETISQDSEYAKRVQNVLQGSEAESSRIMRYLFKEPSGEQESDKPW